ncbi:hypothetical protein BOX15_Mlig004207g1, partial [Macrostomum lignano]
SYKLEMAEETEQQQQGPPPPPPREDKFGDVIKATMDSLSPPDQELQFYADGLVAFANSLSDDEMRFSFKKNNGFNVLIRNPKISAVMAKTVDNMYPDELKVLKSAYTLCKHASRDFKDNAVRSLQVRGVIDNVFEMVCTEKRMLEDVSLEGIQYAIGVLSDPNVCKLMCNKYDLTETALFDSDYGIFGSNKIRANMHLMLRTGSESDLARAEAYKLVATIALCPRFYVRVIDQDSKKIDYIAKAIREGLVNGSEHPKSFGEFCNAAYRLCQHYCIREALMRQPGLVEACRTAIENLLDEVSPEGTLAMGRMFGCMSMLLMDLPQTDEILSECNAIGEMVNKVLNSGRAAETRRWARAAATALEMRRLHDNPGQLFNAACRHFLEQYESQFNKTDEFGPTPERIADAEQLLNLFNGQEWFDAPQLFFAGAFHCLGEAVADKRGTELYTKFKEKGGFDMLIRHRSIPRIVRTPLKKMTHHELYVMMGLWSMGLKIMPDCRDTVIRYIQMPNIIDISVEMIREPNKYPGAMRVLSMEVMCMVCEKTDVCRMICNRINFPEFMMKLFSEPITVEYSDRIEELQYRLFRQLVQCPKLAYRLNEERHFKDVIDGLEELIQDGWNRPVMFRRLLDCAYVLMGNVSLRSRPWDRPSMMEAVGLAIGMMATMGDGVPDEEASVYLIRLADLLLKRKRDEELLNGVKMITEFDYLPEACRERAKKCVEEITFRD